jgi:hypothetical protein
MRSFIGKLLSLTILAIYASVSLLGQGLHLLTPHSHHAVRHSTSVAAHCHCHEHHCQRSSDVADSQPSVEAHASQSGFRSGEIVETHSCEICAFLALAVSPPPLAPTPLISEPLTVATISAPQPFYASIKLGANAARGPPAANC